MSKYKKTEGMNYLIVTRLLKDGPRYAVGYEMVTAPEVLYVRDDEITIFYDFCKSIEQAMSFCKFLVEADIVEAAYLIGEQGNERNEGGDSGDN